MSSPVSGGVNLFANDGSFLELFKQKMEEQRRQRQEEPLPGPLPPDQPATAAAAAAGPRNLKRKGSLGSMLSFVGKCRGGNKLALKKGIVAKKQKMEDEVLTSKGDAWAKYMAEVKKYKAHQCRDMIKLTPLPTPTHSLGLCDVPNYLMRQQGQSSPPKDLNTEGNQDASLSHG